jgi:hypothetical protein
MYYFYLNYIRLNSMCNKLEILLDLNFIMCHFFNFFLKVNQFPWQVQVDLRRPGKLPALF